MKSHLALLISFVWAISASAITIDTVPVGTVLGGYVDNAFEMGKTEVTNAQYVAFLNQVAGSDPYGLYSTAMATETTAGIVRSGSAPNFTYAVKPPAHNSAYDNKPVVLVNLGDAMRFANWLHNGQPTGGEDSTTTERGAYKLDGAISKSALEAVRRSAGARWWLPGDGEWEVAAYYDPQSGTFYNYPTSSNTIDSHGPSTDSGHSVNYNLGIIRLTDAGAYTLSHSPYGTFDQGGNVWEWTDNHDARGGSSADDFRYITRANSLSTAIFGDSSEYIGLGFRVASAAVPEPSTLVLSILALAALPTRRRKSVPDNLV